VARMQALERSLDVGGNSCSPSVTRHNSAPGGQQQIRVAIPPPPSADGVVPAEDRLRPSGSLQTHQLLAGRKARRTPPSPLASQEGVAVQPLPNSAAEGLHQSMTLELSPLARGGAQVSAAPAGVLSRPAMPRQAGSRA